MLIFIRSSYTCILKHCSHLGLWEHGSAFPVMVPPVSFNRNRHFSSSGISNELWMKGKNLTIGYAWDWPPKSVIREEVQGEKSVCWPFTNSFHPFSITLMCTLWQLWGQFYESLFHFKQPRLLIILVGFHLFLHFFYMTKLTMRIKVSIKLDVGMVIIIILIILPTKVESATYHFKWETRYICRISDQDATYYQVCSVLITIMCCVLGLHDLEHPDVALADEW